MELIVIKYKTTEYIFLDEQNKYIRSKSILNL